MILAAGRGERMKALTQTLPKPLLKVGDHYLIEYAIKQCQRAHIHEIVINAAYHADKLQAALGDGSRYGVQIEYSIEAERLETGGGIVKALPLLGDQPFVVLSGDIITPYSLSQLPRELSQLAHLVLVPNPDFHPEGDFGLQDGRISRLALPKYTFGNISVLHPDLFKGCDVSHFPLNHLLFPAIEKGEISGELYKGPWYNVGNPSQLASIQSLAAPDLLYA